MNLAKYFHTLSMSLQLSIRSHLSILQKYHKVTFSLFVLKNLANLLKCWLNTSDFLNLSNTYNDFTCIKRESPDVYARGRSGTAMMMMEGIGWEAWLVDNDAIVFGLWVDFYYTKARFKASETWNERGTRISSILWWCRCWIRVVWWRCWATYVKRTKWWSHFRAFLCFCFETDRWCWNMKRSWVEQYTAVYLQTARFKMWRSLLEKCGFLEWHWF